MTQYNITKDNSQSTGTRVFRYKTAGTYVQLSSIGCMVYYSDTITFRNDPWENKKKKKWNHVRNLQKWVKQGIE